MEVILTSDTQLKNHMIQNQYKVFAERVCQILNEEHDNPVDAMIRIEEEAAALGWATTTDDTRSNGGRPEYGITS